jgi:hypothetical protein
MTLAAGAWIAPSALAMSVLPQSPLAGSLVHFTMSATREPDTCCTWNFGDGTSVTAGMSIDHQFTRPGIYQVSVNGAFERLAGGGGRVTERAQVIVRPASSPIGFDDVPPGQDVSEWYAYLGVHMRATCWDTYSPRVLAVPTTNTPSQPNALSSECNDDAGLPSLKLTISFDQGQRTVAASLYPGDVTLRAFDQQGREITASAVALNWMWNPVSLVAQPGQSDIWAVTLSTSQSHSFRMDDLAFSR